MNDSIRSPWFLAVFALAALWWTLDLAVLRAGTPHPSDDHWEDHLIAERLLAGDGFRTNMIYPPLWGLRDDDGTIPVLVHGPLLALLTVPALALLPREALDSVALPAAMVALVTLIPLYRLAARNFGVAVAAATAGLYTLSPLTLEAVHHSGSVIVGAGLMTWALDAMARATPRPLMAGVLAGVASLVRPEAWLALPVLAWLGWRAGAPPARLLVRIAFGFAVCALPWWAYRAAAVGSPWFNLTSYTLIGFWGARPDVSVMQDFALTPARWPAVLRAELPGVIPKWVAHVPRAIKHLLFTPTGGTGWLAVVGLIAAVTRRASFSSPAHTTGTMVSSRRLAWCAAALMLIPLAAMTLTFPQRLYLVPFAPLLAWGSAVGAATLAGVMPAWARRPRAWIGMLALLVLPSSLPALRGAAAEARVLERRVKLERDELLREFSKHGHGPAPRVIFSDTPDFVAWVTGRPTLWVTREAFLELYAGDSAGAARHDLPLASEVAGWFHDDFRNPRAIGERVFPGTRP